MMLLLSFWLRICDLHGKFASAVGRFDPWLLLCMNLQPAEQRLFPIMQESVSLASICVPRFCISRLLVTSFFNGNVKLRNHSICDYHRPLIPKDVGIPGLIIHNEKLQKNSLKKTVVSILSFPQSLHIPFSPIF